MGTAAKPQDLFAADSDVAALVYGRGDDPEPECDRERYRAEDRHFWRQILERASPGTKHEMALCQLTGSYQK